MPDPSPQTGVSDGCGVDVYRMETGDFFRFDGRKPWDIPTTATMGKWFPTDAESLASIRQTTAEAIFDRFVEGPPHTPHDLADAVLRALFGDPS